MPKLERVRDFLSAAPSADYFHEKAADGWRLIAIEWERGAPATPSVEDVPFGLRVASDCRRLEENPDEMQVLVLMMETIVQDGPLSQAAQAINDRGFRTRDGEKWTPQALFYLLPRLIEVGPKLCTSEQWIERRKHLFNVV
ncbi:MAG TPA: recombinase family protein [Bryobacteraceae bacterium]|nr:recombinase family protein [Bryobacteraceae bacterium]